MTRCFSSTDRFRLASRLGVPLGMTRSDVSIYSSWTLIDVPASGSILIYSHFVQTVLTGRLPYIYVCVILGKIMYPSTFLRWFPKTTCGIENNTDGQRGLRI